MKIVNTDELKSLECKGPFYLVLDNEKKDEKDPRGCGCATLAILNTLLLLKERLGINNGETAYNEMINIQTLAGEENNVAKIKNMMTLIDSHPVFNNSRILVMNPNGMDEEVFWNIFLRRLSQGNIAMVLMEVPKEGDSLPQDKVNHSSVVHSENGEVYFDGLRVDLNFLANALFYSRENTVLMFALNPGDKNEK